MMFQLSGHPGEKGKQHRANIKANTTIYHNSN